jgi:DNA repair exonuclease SbcCD ATPase subunit
MGKVYESLKEVVTLQRTKNDPIPLAGIKQTHMSSSGEEINGLEKLIVQKIDGWKASVNQSEEVVKKVQGAGQVIGALRENIAMLETDLKEIEESFRIKDFASKEMEESLTANIHDLKDELKKNKETLQSRDNEINSLKSNADVLVRQVTELELAVKQSKADAEAVANRTREMTERSNNKIAELEAQIRDINEIVRGKESAIKALEQELAPKLQELENQLSNKDTLLAARDAEINELKSQLQVLTRGIKEMSSFVSQAEASADVGKKSVSTTNVSDRMNGGEKTSLGAAAKIPLVTSKATHTPQQTVPRTFFEFMTRELTLIKGPMASTTVRDHVTALGESMEKFPRSRVPELLEILSKEIPNEELKIGFRKWFVKHV